MMVRLRRMNINDMDMVRSWRMMPEITRYMYTDPIISLEEQKEWFYKISKSDDKYWVVEQDSNPIGLASLINYDRKNERVTGGAYIAEKNKDTLRIAIGLQYNLLRYAFEIMGVNKVCGEVISENVGALKILELCGSVREGVLRQHVKKNNKYYDVVIQSTLLSDWEKIKDKAYKNKYDMEVIE